MVYQLWREECCIGAAAEVGLSLHVVIGGGVRRLSLLGLQSTVAYLGTNEEGTLD